MPEVAGAPGVAEALEVVGSSGVAGALEVAGSSGIAGALEVAGSSGLVGSSGVAGEPGVVGTPGVAVDGTGLSVTELAMKSSSVYTIGSKGYIPGCLKAEVMFAGVIALG
uniref:Uncharacterized protein n=1 Tax=Cacopsylla melanoneura TaxID=428564 RepID=A0A8D8TH48_9HEMI